MDHQRRSQSHRRRITGATTTLTPDADAYIYELNPNTNYGSAGNLYVREHTNPNDARILLSFDLSSLAGKTVKSARLRLHLANWSGSGATLTARRLLVDWIEGQATWNNRQTGVAWNTAGCNGAGTDYNADSLGTVTPGATGAYCEIELNAAGIAVLQGWIDGNIDNHGLRLTLGSTAWHLYDDRSDPTPPQLAITT